MLSFVPPGVPAGALAFALLCLLALLAVLCDVLFEVGRVRREDPTGNIVIARSQFHLRLLSALVWCLALGLLAYCASLGWPVSRPGASSGGPAVLQSGLDPRRWLSLMGGAMLLVLIGIALLFYDLWRVRARARVQEGLFHQQLELMAQREAERLQRPSLPGPSEINPR
jgi:hypothetical protein